MTVETVSNKSVTDIIKKFQNHPSIVKIKEKHREHSTFSAVEVEDINRKFDSLDASKAIRQNGIPVKAIKASRGDIFSDRHSWY